MKLQFFNNETTKFDNDIILYVTVQCLHFYYPDFKEKRRLIEAFYYRTHNIKTFDVLYHMKKYIKIQNIKHTLGQMKRLISFYRASFVVK